MADSAFLSADSISEVASSAVCLAQLLNSLRLALILCWFCGSRISVRIFSVSPRICSPVFFRKPRICRSHWCLSVMLPCLPALMVARQCFCPPLFDRHFLFLSNPPAILELGLGIEHRTAAMSELDPNRTKPG